MVRVSKSTIFLPMSLTYMNFKPKPNRPETSQRLVGATRLSPSVSF